MARRLTALAAVTMLSFPGTASAGELKLSLKDGRVTIIAQDVPLRQILDEFSRVGKTEIVNADKLTGPSMTLHMVDVPERQVLDILFKAASGYMVTPRATADASLSQYHRILVMVPSGPPAPATAGNRPVVSAPNPNNGMPTPNPNMNPNGMPTNGDDDGNNPGFGTPAGGRPPETMFNYANPLQLQQQQLQMQQQQQLQEQAAGAAVPGMTGSTPGGGGPPGTARPGVVVQPPPPPANFRNPYGLPSGVQPGSVTPPPGQQPDRSKYSNPGGPPPGL
jgi:hypothetical protein